MEKYKDAGADISECRKYRFRLWREWNAPQDEQGTVTFVMLNPSTADGEKDDPTIRRCVGFARREGYNRLEVVNLYAYRATSPRDLFAGWGSDIVGGDKQYDAIVRQSIRSDLIIAGWGANMQHRDRHVRKVMGWIERPIFCLGRTKQGHPRHPLYVKAGQPLEDYRTVLDILGDDPERSVGGVAI